MRRELSSEPLGHEQNYIIEMIETGWTLGQFDFKVCALSTTQYCFTAAQFRIK